MPSAAPLRVKERVPVAGMATNDAVDDLAPRQLIGVVLVKTTAGAFR
jgi:hypothetical protein